MVNCHLLNARERTGARGGATIGFTQVEERVIIEFYFENKNTLDGKFKGLLLYEETKWEMLWSRKEKHKLG